MKEIVIATRNKKKLYELKAYLKGIKARIRSLKDLNGAPSVREDGDTFKKNAIKKALAVSKFTKGLVLADDSGLVVDALNGRPGVRSSRFAGPKKDDRDNNLKLLKCLEGIPLKKRKARFVCAVAIADKGKLINVTEEDCKGLVAFSIRGRYGFGYDPLFLIPKYKKTFGELGLRIKDKMSHRAKALKKAREFLKKYL
ncbi:MAG: XTP/dITP diphosphatase [Candidatus Omnitrophica bacterium]|nr:XTP/dITP diphosphatase [Candidatus Omnitrophota bacterium]